MLTMVELASCRGYVYAQRLRFSKNFVRLELFKTELCILLPWCFCPFYIDILNSTTLIYPPSRFEGERSRVVLSLMPSPCLCSRPCFYSKSVHTRASCQMNNRLHDLQLAERAQWRDPRCNRCLDVLRYSLSCIISNYNASSFFVRSSSVDLWHAVTRTRCSLNQLYSTYQKVVKYSA